MDISKFLLLTLAFHHHCEGFVFTSSPNTTTTVCDGDAATFNWIYSTGSPTSIGWTKLNDDSTVNATLATFSIGSFIPDATYGSRVTQVGNAGITIRDVTPADNGIYQVEVADGSSSLKGTTTLTISDTPTGTIRASYSNNTNVVMCDGLTSLGYGSLSLVLDGTTIQTTESLSLEHTSSTGGKFCCCVIMRGDSAKCLPAGDSYTNCSAECVEVEAPVTNSTETPGPDAVTDADPFPIIAVVILVILLVLKLVTDVLYVGYRWENKIGVQYTKICKWIINTVKKEYILYWSCFIQGIIDIICGVAFFIVMCTVYTERLEESLHVAVLVMCIIIGSIGVVNIVMCLCCSCSHKSSDHVDKAGTSETSSKGDGPSSWLCCCCPVAISPEKVSAKSPPAPMPAAMASPRKPVPPNSTSARPLPSPTSDPASDSAVNPKVLPEPLNVEEPKKKKKRRKNRKKAKEAGGESSDPPVNTGDSDD